MRTDAINNLFMMVGSKKHKGLGKGEGIEQIAFSEILGFMNTKHDLSKETMDYLAELKLDGVFQEPTVSEEMGFETNLLSIQGLGNTAYLKDSKDTKAFLNQEIRVPVVGSKVLANCTELDIPEINSEELSTSNELGASSELSTPNVLGTLDELSTPAVINNREKPGAVSEISDPNEARVNKETSNLKEITSHWEPINTTELSNSKALTNPKEYSNPEMLDCPEKQSEQWEPVNTSELDYSEELNNLKAASIPERLDDSQELSNPKELSNLKDLGIHKELENQKRQSNIVEPGKYKELSKPEELNVPLRNPKESNESKEQANPLNLTNVTKEKYGSMFLSLSGNQFQNSNEFNKSFKQELSSPEKGSLIEEPQQFVFQSSSQLSDQTTQIAKTPSNQNIPILQNKVGEQIIRHFSFMQNNGLSQVNVDLKPEFLGQVSINLTFERGKVTAKIEVAKTEVKKLLEGQVSQLKTALNEMNIKVEEFKIELNDKESASRFTQKEGFQNPERDSRGNQNFEGKREYKLFNHESFDNEEKNISLVTNSRFISNEVNYMV